MELVLKIYYLLQVAIVLLMVGCLILLVFLKLKGMLLQTFSPKFKAEQKKSFAKNRIQLSK